MNSDNESQQLYGVNEDEQYYMYHESGDMDDSTEFTDVTTSRSKLEKYANLDPGHKVIGKKNTRLEYYVGSQVIGTPIRNALTGIYEYNMKVGNRNDEAQYFKVKYAAANSTNNLDTLYYDSPEQFERHMHSKLNQHTKEKWNRDYITATTLIHSTEKYAE